MAPSYDFAPRAPRLPVLTGVFSHYPIRLYLSSPDELLLRGLKALIDRWAPEIHQVGESYEFRHMVSDCAHVKPTVVVMDGQFMLAAGEEWLELTAQHPTLVLVDDYSSPVCRTALEWGARGIVRHSEVATQLIHGIERLHAGDSWVPTALLQLARRYPGGKPLEGNMHRLTPSELETARTMLECAGAKNLVIAEKLNISESTLRNRLTVIYDKLGISGKAALVLYARENGLYRPYL